VTRAPSDVIRPTSTEPPPGTPDDDHIHAVSVSAQTVLLVRAIGLAATFVGSVALARALGPEGRGAQGFFVASTILLVAVTGLSAPIGDYILATRTGTGRRVLAVNAVWIAVAAGLIAGAGIVVIQAATEDLPTALVAVPAWPLAFAIGVAGFTWNAHQIQLALAAGRAVVGAFLSFGTFSIAGIGNALILLAGGDLVAAVWMVALSPYLATIVALAVRPSPGTVALGRPDGSVVRRAFREGWRYFPGDLASIVHLRLDVVLLGILTPASTVGIYVVAYQTAEPVLVIASAATATVLALGHRVGADQGEDAAVRLIRETVAMGLLLGVVAALAAPILVPVIYGSAFGDAVGPLMVLLPAVILLAISRIAIADLTRHNHLEETVTASVVALLVNLALNLVLIPRAGALGAAAASLGSYFAQAALSIRYQRGLNRAPWSAYAPRTADVIGLIRAWRPDRLVRLVLARHNESR
jgi:O-antigen/teichoic acid export membrane protein